MRRVSAVIAFAALAALPVGCMYPEEEAPEDNTSDVSLPSETPELRDLPTTATLAPGDRHAVLTRDGAVKLGVTDEQVYLRLSDTFRARLDSTVTSKVNREVGEGGLKRMIGNVVEKSVSGALGFQMDKKLDEIRDVRWSGGELIIEQEDGKIWKADEIQIGDDTPVLENFRESDARAFIAEFRRAKAERQ